jgi:hypothetical protein
VCILCLDDSAEPAAPDDGTDTQCLLQEWTTCEWTTWPKWGDVSKQL